MIHQPWDIPKIWKWVEIKSLGEIVSGGTPSTKEASYWGNDVNWISPADLTGYTKKTIARGAKSLSHQGLAKSSAKLMPSGSIHFSSRAPIGYVVISSQPLSTNQGFKSLVPTQGLFNEYGYYYLKAAKHIAEERASGTTFREISGSAFGKLPFPFAPLTEQYQIVSKIEELFSELDNGVENLKKAQEQLKTYRQAVLKHAFEGKLTREWREQQKQAGNPPEPAESLLARIKKERDTQYQKQVEAWQKACEQAKNDGSKKPAKPRKPKDLPPLTEKELGELPELPEGWGWIKIGSLCSVVRGGSPRPAGDPKYYGGNIPFLKVADITGDTQPYLKDYKYTIKESGLKKTRMVNENTLLISNSGATLGVPKICLIRATFNDGIAAFLGIQNEWLLFHYYFWLSKTEQLRNINQGAAQPNLNTDIIADIALPLCSQSEQKQIVSEIETRLSVCDQLEQTIEDSLRKADALRQSILKKAFEGELTKEWRDAHPELISGENSAESLLARIQAEKEKNLLRKARKGKTKK